MGNTIRQVSDMVLAEAAPAFDEALAIMFSEIDANPNIALEDKDGAKKTAAAGLVKAAKGVALAGAIGGGGYLAARNPAVREYAHEMYAKGSKKAGELVSAAQKKHAQWSVAPSKTKEVAAKFPVPK